MFYNVVLNVILHCVISYLIASHNLNILYLIMIFAFKYRLVLNCLLSYLHLNNNIVSCFNYVCHVVLSLISRFSFIVFHLSCFVLLSYFCCCVLFLLLLFLFYLSYFIFCILFITFYYFYWAQGPFLA